MAVNGELLVYPGQELTPQDFAIMMERISVIQSGILSGCVVTRSETETNTLNVAEGYLFIKGRLVKVNEGTLDTSNLSTSVSDWYVYAELHLDPDIILEEPVSIYVSDTTPRNPDSEDFNVNNSGYATAVLAIYNRYNNTVKQVTTPTPISFEDVTLTFNSTAYGANLMTCTISDPRITEDTYIEIIPRSIGDDTAYLRQLQRADLQVYSVSLGTLVIGCYGVRPSNGTIDVTIVYRGMV